MAANLFKELSTPLEPISTGIAAKLKKLEDIRAVIFDIYGTLEISGTGDISIAQSIDRESELRAILNSNGYKQSLGQSLSETFYKLVQQDHEGSRQNGAQFPEVDILEIWKRFFQVATGKVPSTGKLAKIAVQFECAVNPVWPMPEWLRTLGELKSSSKHIGIVSNAQFYTPLMLEGFSGKSLTELGFEGDLSIWSYQEGLGKPSVELFEKLKKALAVHSITPSQTLYVGNDMLNDIWTANQVGLKTALFAGDKRSLRLRDNDDRCNGLEPDVILTQLVDLSKVL